MAVPSSVCFQNGLEVGCKWKIIILVILFSYKHLSDQATLDKATPWSFMVSQCYTQTAPFAKSFYGLGLSTLPQAEPFRSKLEAH